MNIEIDTDVTFTLPNDRKAVVDALEFDDLMQSMWEKAEKTPKVNGDGKPEIGADGQPLQLREIKWEEIEKALIPWFKEHGQVDLKRSEVRAIWAKSQNLWAKKNESWQEAPPEKESPILPSSIDARCSD